MPSGSPSSRATAQASFHATPDPGQRVFRVPELRVQDGYRGVGRFFRWYVMVRHHHVNSQRGREFHLVLIRDAAVSGDEEVHTLREEVPYVRL